MRGRGLPAVFGNRVRRERGAVQEGAGDTERGVFHGYQARLVRFQPGVAGGGAGRGGEAIMDLQFTMYYLRFGEFAPCGETNYKRLRMEVRSRRDL